MGEVLYGLSFKKKIELSSRNGTPAIMEKPFYPAPKYFGKIFSCEYIPNRTWEDSEISHIGSKSNGLSFKSNPNPRNNAKTTLNLPGMIGIRE